MNVISPCCKNSERWHMIGVSYILTNEKYTGNTLLQKTYSTNTLPVRRFKNNGNADQYYVRNTHPAIIQQETFDKVQRLISEKNQKQPRGTPHNSALHKHIFCGSCGSILIRKSCRKNIIGRAENTILQRWTALPNKFPKIKSTPLLYVCTTSSCIILSLYLHHYSKPCRI